MKSGSGDDLWGDDGEDTEPGGEETGSPVSDNTPAVENGSSGSTPRGSTSETTMQNTGQQRQSRTQLPHRIRCDSPKENRIEKTILIDQDDESRLDELQSLAKQTFDERVYKIDVYLAATRAGLQSRDERFLEAMREIGYDYDHQSQ